MCLIYDVNPAFIHDTIRPKTVSVHLASFNDSNMFLFRRIQPMHFAAAGEGKSRDSGTIECKGFR